jgi:hypothetical protein
MSDLMENSLRCPCGETHPPLDSVSAKALAEFVRDLGLTVVMRTPSCAFRVPRVFVAHHGMKAWELPDLAQRYGWEAV